MRLLTRLFFLLFLLGATAAQNPVQRGDQLNAMFGKFTDVTSSLGLRFQYLPSHTSRKYLIETMGAGVALLDYDNDGRLDIFLVNGAPISDPTPKGSIPRKTTSKYWDRLYHQRKD